MFAELREGQKLVLGSYAKNHLNTPDLAIEMPTGEGKTLVALLIADLALDRGWSVAYLTGTKQLAERVEQEAKALGVESARFSSGNYGGARLQDYHHAQSIGIMNYWVYFNHNPRPQPADLVIFDDAHLAEQPVTSMQTVRISKATPEGAALYATICDLILAKAEDAYPGLHAFRDGTALPGTPPELLSFSDWSDVSTAATAAIDKSPVSGEKAMKYPWGTVRQNLKRCGVLIGPTAIEIRPYHPPTTLMPSYSRSRQRIYLSGTLGTMDDLQRRVGTATITKLETDEPLPPGASGYREFFLNPSGGKPLDPETIDWAMEQVKAAGGRAAWLCASHSEADTLETILHARGESTFRLKPTNDDIVDTWAAAQRGHLITAGRYDGLDLAGDICKLVIITTVPQASSEFERFVVAYLGDATHMRHRVGQRVTQALGRANRDATDRSMYLGLDPTFPQILADPAVTSSIPEGSRADIRAALERADEGWAATMKACRAFWANTASTTTASPAGATTGARRARPGRARAGSGSVPSAPAEVSAATNLWIGDHAQAAKQARDAAAILAGAGETEHGAFWRYVEAHALFDQGTAASKAAAQQALIDATNDGPPTTWFRRLRRTVASLEGISGGASSDLDRLFLGWDEWWREAGQRLDAQLAAARVELQGTHDQRCDGLVTLARLVGVPAERPPAREQSATDCRWTWSTRRRGERRVWEVKTTSAEAIARADVNQLLGQIQVESQRSGQTRVYGCLMSSGTSAQPDAAEAASSNIALINDRAVLRLFDLLAERLKNYAAQSGDGTAEARGNARTAVEATLPTGRWLEKLLAPNASGTVIGPEDVQRLFTA